MNISEVEFSFPAAHAGNVFGQFDAHMKKIERLHGDGVRLVYTVRNNSGADRSI